MENLMNEMIENTRQNLDERLKKNEELRQQKDAKLKETLAKLETEIMTDFENKVREASNNGYDNTTIYRFDSKHIFEEYKTSFLLKGPLLDRRNEGTGLDFFYNKEIVPVMERLKNQVKPFIIYLRYDRYKKENMIIVSWKKTT